MVVEADIWGKCLVLKPEDLAAFNRYCTRDRTLYITGICLRIDLDHLDVVLWNTCNLHTGRRSHDAEIVMRSMFAGIDITQLSDAVTNVFERLFHILNSWDNTRWARSTSRLLSLDWDIGCLPNNFYTPQGFVCAYPLLRCDFRGLPMAVSIGKIGNTIDTAENWMNSYSFLTLVTRLPNLDHVLMPLALAADDDQSFDEAQGKVLLPVDM